MSYGVGVRYIRMNDIDFSKNGVEKRHRCQGPPPSGDWVKAYI